MIPTIPMSVYISLGDYAYLGVALNLDADRVRHTHYGLVYKSTNGGQTWAPTGLGFDPTGSGRLLNQKSVC
ncbi:MAG: hypothetical protein R3B93_22430 [Bacteroidia bacterium]